MSTPYGSRNDEEEHAFVGPTIVADLPPFPSQGKLNTKRVLLAASVGLLGATGAYVALQDHQATPRAVTINAAATLKANFLAQSSVSAKDSFTSFDALDTDHNGLVTKQEFLSRLSERREDVVNRIASSNLDQELKTNILRVVQTHCTQESTCVANVFDKSQKGAVDRDGFDFVVPIIIDMCAISPDGMEGQEPAVVQEGTDVIPMVNGQVDEEGQGGDELGSSVSLRGSSNGADNDDGTGEDDLTPQGYDNQTPGNNESEYGGDVNTAGGDDVANGGEDATGNDVDTAGGDDAAAGGEDATGNDVDTAGGDDAAAGGEEAATGGEDATGNDVDTAGGDDATAYGEDDNAVGNDDSIPSGDDASPAEDNDSTPSDEDSTSTVEDDSTRSYDNSIPSGDDSTPTDDGVFTPAEFDDSTVSGDYSQPGDDSSQTYDDITSAGGDSTLSGEDTASTSDENTADASSPSFSDAPFAPPAAIADFDNNLASDNKSAARTSFETELTEKFQSELDLHQQELAVAQTEVKKQTFLLSLVQSCISNAGQKFQYDSTFDITAAMTWVKEVCLKFPDIHHDDV